MRVPPSEDDRQQAALVLQRACGDGRLTLEEFGVRVGAVWAAETADEIVRATADLAPSPIVGSAVTVDKVITVFSENKRRGRWRMRTPKVSVRTAFGSTELDLRGVISDQPVIEIVGGSYFGEVKVIVPEGVEVELTGAAIFSSRTMHLAPVPRVPGTPEVRVHLQTWFSSVEIISKPYALPQ
jgi:hypothetical protein